MKNKLSKLSLTFALLCLCLFSVACSGDDGPDDEQEREYLTATVGGEEFASSLSMNVNQMNGVTTIIGAGNNGGIMLQFSNSSAGSYPIGGDNSGALTIAAYTQNTNNGIVAWQAPIDQSVSQGQIVVTNFSENNVKGTFNFTGTNTDDNSTVEVTNGKFNIDF